MNHIDIPKEIGIVKLSSVFKTFLDNASVTAAINAEKIPAIK